MRNQHLPLIDAGAIPDGAFVLAEIPGEVVPRRYDGISMVFPDILTYEPGWQGGDGGGVAEVHNCLSVYVASGH